MKKRIGSFILIAICLLLNIRPVFAGDDVKAEQAKIAGLIEGLAGKYREERSLCKDELLRIGIPAEQQLVEALNSEKYYIRLHSIQILGELRSAKAVPFFINILASTQNPEIKDAVKQALLSNYVATKEYVDNNKFINPGLLNELNQLKKEALKMEVERRLYELIPDFGGPGFYDGQFDGIRGLGPEALPVLTEIAQAALDLETLMEYSQFGNDAYKKKYYEIYLAISSLGELGSEKEKQLLQDILARYNYDGYDQTRELYGEAAAFALYKLGDKDNINEITSNLENDLNGNVSSDPVRQEMLRGNLAVIYIKTSQVDKAIAEYEKMVPAAVNRELGGLYYNLACLYSSKKDVKKALYYLKLAVDNGYTDYEWITMDGDMKLLMKEQEFEEVVSKIKITLPAKKIPGENKPGQQEIY